MTTTITEPLIDVDRKRQTAKARAEVLSRAKAQGVKPFNSLEDFVGDPEVTTDFDIVEFLKQIIEDRDLPSSRKVH